MEKQFKFIFVLGILLVLLPWSGLPSAWSVYITSIIGLILILIVVIRHVNAPLNGGASVKEVETIYIDNDGHVSESAPEGDSSEEIKEVEIDLEPGQKMEVHIEDKE